MWIFCISISSCSFLCLVQLILGMEFLWKQKTTQRKDMKKGINETSEKEMQKCDTEKEKQIITLSYRIEATFFYFTFVSVFVVAVVIFGEYTVLVAVCCVYILLFSPIPFLFVYFSFGVVVWIFLLCFRIETGLVLCVFYFLQGEWTDSSW